ncbi:MAG: putative LPS assembly protein LptD [Paludibacter sp.]
MQICNQLYFSKSPLILVFFFWLAIPYSGLSQTKVASPKPIEKSAKIDSISQKKDSTIETTKPKSNKIDAEIVYSAQDSIVFLGNGTGFLYGKSDIKYKNINLKSEFVRVKMDSSTVYATGKTDSLGKKIGEPVFTENKTEYNSRELTYNLKTRKGYIRQAVTKQGEGYVISDKTKKSTTDILCMTDGKYTTCDNHEHPDFYLDLTRGKVKPGGYIVAGPAYLVVEDVPLPIALPFGFFPFTDKYSSGILMPTFQDELTRGFGLTNGGYYFAINDYADLELRGDIYTKGTWALSASSGYMKRYKFRGNFNISYRQDVIGEKEIPSTYSTSNNLSIRWSHSQDSKANPFFNFSSSVNFSTSGYNRSNINSYYNPALNSENTKSSSVSFTQRFPESPFSISGSMLINQRTKDSTISMSLPNVNISMSRIYPFKRKDAIGKERWYEKISMSYSGSLSNSIETKENRLLSSSFVRDWRNGMRHSIPISATFDLFKYINISPSVNYNERWYLSSINRSWDKTNQKVKTDTVAGFNRVYDFNMGISASTTLYGFYQPIRSLFGDKIDRIRHVMKPSLGFSYMPDFGESMWGYYGTYVQSIRDASNPLVFHDQVVQYSHYENSLFGTPGAGKSGNLNFSLSNNVEMKVKNDKDTTGTKPFNIISLIDNFTVGSSYNMAADSMQWSLFNTNLRIKLGKNYTLSLSGAFDPYMYGLNSGGYPVRINKLRWANGGFPRFMGTSTSYSYTFNNDTFKKKSTTPKKNTTGNQDNKIPTKDDSNTSNLQGNTSSQNQESKQEKPIDGYQKIAIPWSVSFSYSILYANTNVFDKSKMEYEMGFTHNLSVSGNISLTTNWRISANSTYDFKANQFTYTNVSVNRSLHCWNMSASIVPFGPFRSYNFHIGVNASMLQDLKYDKQSGYGTTPITWY